ncbi:MAG TPA: SDR family oxidoreductase [Chloroflexota bacterium]|nr:SDR family oxidoreductase [Chloroflexota bacterium]
MDWANRVAIVSGASSGIGQATARRLLSEGARVALVARRLEPLESVASIAPDRSLVLLADVSQRDAVRRLVDQVLDRWQRVDVLVHSAGLLTLGPLELSEDRAVEILGANLLGAIWFAQSVLPPMRQNAFGRIVFVGSVDSYVAPAGYSLYAASKWGLRALAQSLRAELHASGIYVSLVSPYYVQTAMLDAERQHGPLPGFRQRDVLAAETIADAILRAADDKQKELVLAPWSIKLGLWLGQLLPGLQDVVLAREGRHLLRAMTSQGPDPSATAR